MRKRRRKASSTRRRVLLFPPTFGAIDMQFARFLEGVADYARPDLPWEMAVVLHDVEPGVLHDMLRDADGALVAAKREGTLDVIRDTGVLVVDHSQEQLAADAGLPRVLLDHQAIGRMGARHLLEKGLRRVCYMARESELSARRWEGFDAQARETGGQALLLEPAAGMGQAFSVIDSSAEVDERLSRMLREADGPIGIMAAQDMAAMQVLRACHRAGLDVPTEAAVLGVHDDQTLCRLALPHLSSVSTPFERLGYEAAAMLHRQMEGEDPGPPVVLPPTHVVQRQSTDMLGAEDSVVCHVLRLLQARFTDDIDVSDLLDQVPLSRRMIELRFKSALGRTIGQELRRLRIERAKLLLSTTTQPISAVAFRSGYTSQVRLSEAFRREVAQTPTAYRRSFRH